MVGVVCLTPTLSSERGATMLEYALMAACIAIVALAGVTSLGAETNRTFTAVEERLANTNLPTVPRPR